MKMQKDLVCVIAYVLGVPVELWRKNYDTVGNLAEITSNDDLQFCRACCYVRQACLYTSHGITEFKAREVMFSKNPSSEQYRAFAQIFGFNCGTLEDVDEILDMPRAIQITKLEMRMENYLRQYLRKFVKEYGYDIDVESIMHVMLFGDEIDLAYWHDVACDKDKMRKYPFSRLLNIKHSDLPMGNLLYTDNIFITACKMHENTVVSSSLDAVKKDLGEYILCECHTIPIADIRQALTSKYPEVENIDGEIEHALSHVRFIPRLHEDNIELVPCYYSNREWSEQEDK